MLREFFKEEKAQGAIEYILLAGGIIVAAVIIFVLYKQMAASSAQTANTTTGVASNKINESVMTELNKL